MANEFEVADVDSPSMFVPHLAQNFVSGNKQALGSSRHIFMNIMNTHSKVVSATCKGA